MKNNKGFTLIELLAIVVILGVIIAVAAPSISKEIDRSEKENQNVLNQKIENAAHLYAAKYYANRIVDNKTFNFTINDLEQDGLLTLNESCSGTISYNKNSHEYNFSGVSCYK